MLSIGKFCSTIFVLVIILTSLAAIGIYSSYTVKPGPKFIRNQFIGLYLSIQLLFYCLQTLYLSYKNPQRFLKPLVFADLAYFTLAIVFSSLSALFHVLTNRVDSCVFSSLIVLINLLNFLLIINRRFETKTHKKYMDYIDFIKTSSFITLQDGFLKKIFRFVNFLLKIFFLLSLILISNGSLMNSMARIKFGAKGTFVNVPLSDKSNRFIKIHLVCDGPKSANRSSFLIEGDCRSSHVDFLGIQRELVKMNRRVCVWDKAGLGYSDFFYSDMRNHGLYYSNFLRSINESRVVLVGMGDGADLVLANAGKLDNLERLVLFDALPTRLRWHAESQVRNWSQNKLQEQIGNFVEKKIWLIKLVNAFAVPLGLVPSVVQRKKFDFSMENNLLWLNEKVWLSEKMYLEQLEGSGDKLFDLGGFDVRVSHVITKKSNDQIYDQLCAPKNQKANSRYCLYEKKMNGYLVSERSKMVNNGSVYECNENECGAEYFIRNAQFTAKVLDGISS
ncbi:hypothetical protein BpHYR1_006824 [Brachionus plicatilis]|uniref:Uncharacterized protein n=1 Tax=Brachionus plicatilis TaxID=10195 RepID=A0A3M7RS25_BRAPC|nr:hypothetical protein BpHYR1_006824 [Brachionus plicatilis]